jgi:hypothetical protein
MIYCFKKSMLQAYEKTIFCFRDYVILLIMQEGTTTTTNNLSDF